MRPCIPGYTGSFDEQGGKQAVRMGKWKGIKLNVTEQPNGPIELYDLTTDVGEKNNVADKHPDVDAIDPENYGTATPGEPRFSFVYKIS